MIESSERPPIRPVHVPTNNQEAATTSAFLVALGRIVESAKENVETCRQVVEEFEEETKSILRWGGEGVVNAVWMKKVAKNRQYKTAAWKFEDVATKFMRHQTEMEAYACQHSRIVDTHVILARRVTFHCDTVVYLAARASSDWMSCYHLAKYLKEIVARYDMNNEQNRKEFLARAFSEELSSG